MSPGTLTTGQLAAAAGTTARAVRHYTRCGLLPEPPRRPNGYRAYDAAALLRLVRIRRLRDLGLSLPEVADALGGAGEAPLREVLGELVADLARQEREVAAARARLERVLAREQDLALPDAVADVVDALRGVLPVADAPLVDAERDVLELVTATAPTAQVDALLDAYGRAVADPAVVARGVAVARRFDDLADVPADDGAVAALAGDMVALAREVIPGSDARAGLDVAQGVDAPGDEAGAVPDDREVPAEDPVWSAYLAGLAPAQRRCLVLVQREVEVDGPGRRVPS